ncbi:hypothetical protein [Spirosoma agri]|uniref:Uncharacterized protein n=1 Tax=Spirosoma agri TaxID=1987381 RepID=A0A6M0IT02_9BACT|nr:hypothetical protein [Spirosoma agri]NEU70721.1 hypothetical protein [Spirosoma agri]
MLSANSKAWFDQGEGVGGNIIELAKRLVPCSDVSQALAYLNKLLGQPIVNNSTPTTSFTNQTHLPAYSLLANEDLLIYANPKQYIPLATYLVSRAIELRRVTPYVRQLTFCPTNESTQQLHGIGLPNQSGGFELRARIKSKYRKTCLGPKDISFFPATFPDRQLRERPFSLLTLWNHNDPPCKRTIGQFRGSPHRVGTMNHLYEGFIDYKATHMAATATKSVKLPPVSLTL